MALTDWDLDYNREFPEWEGTATRGDYVAHPHTYASGKTLRHMHLMELDTDHTHDYLNDLPDEGYTLAALANREAAAYVIAYDGYHDMAERLRPESLGSIYRERLPRENETETRRASMDALEAVMTLNQIEMDCA